MKLKRLIPVLLIPLMVLLASPSAQAYSGYYYVIPTSAPLRECASVSCDVLHTVYQGNKVQILEQTPAGWSKVRLADREASGWIRTDLLSYSPDLKTKQMPTYYVNTSSLTLRQHPRPNANAVTTLHFNDPVEMLGVGTSGWAQVRVPHSNVIGYAPPRYLSETPVSHHKARRRHRRAPAHQQAPEKEKAPSEAPAPPKAM